MIDKKDIKKALGEVFQEVGFLHKGQSWFLTGSDSIVVINLQKSDFDKKYYINIGVWLKRFGDVSFPKENQCHIQTRLTSLFNEHASLIEDACSLEKGTETNMKELVDFLRAKAVPFFRTCSTEEGLSENFRAGCFRRALVMKIAKDALFATND